MSKLPPARAKKLQDLLNRVVKPKPLLAVDGIVGKKTTAALVKLQAMAGLKKTGIVDAETASVIARAMKTGKVEKEQPTHFVKINGKWIGLTERQYKQQKQKIIKDLQRGPMLQMKINVATADAEWLHFDELNSKQWFVAMCIETTRGVKLPNHSVIAKAHRAYKECDALLKAGNLKKFYGTYPKAELIVNETVEQMLQYRKQMIEGGGNWVTGLTYTKTASFTFVGVFAAPAVGAALGTGVVASAMIGGAAVAATESAAGEIGNYSAGKEKWTPGGAILNVLIDGGVGAVIGAFSKGGSGGKHIVEATVTGLAKRIGKLVGFKLLKNALLRKIALTMLVEGFKKTLEDALKDAAKAAKGDEKMTIDKFKDNLLDNFVKGAALAPIGMAIERVSKAGADFLDPKDKQRIRDLIDKELMKQAKGQTVHVSIFDKMDKRTDDLIEKIINDEIAKSLEPTLEGLFDKWKGPLTKAVFEKELKKKLLTPAVEKKITKEATKVINKKMKVKG